MPRRAQAKPATPAVTLEDINRGSAEDKLSDEEIIALAERNAADASSDTEEDLEELFIISARKRYFNDTQPGGKRYLELRDRLAKRLAETGPRLFTHKGRKYVGIRQQAIPVIIDEAKLVEAIGDRTGLLDVVMPRKVDREQFKRACARKEFTAEQIGTIARFGVGKEGKAAFIRYIEIKDE